MEKKLTKELAYILGALRDGCISKYKEKSGKLHYHLSIYSKCIGWLKILQKFFKKTLGKAPKIVIPRNRTPYLRIYSKEIAEMFHTRFQHPLSQQVSWQTPSAIKESKNKDILKWYVAGFYDAEGGVDIHKKEAKFYLSWNGEKCPPLEDIKEILEKVFGIKTGKVCRYTNPRGKFPRFVLRIKRKFLEKFFLLFPLQHPQKLRKLKAVLSRETAHLPRSRAPKMEGTKPTAETPHLERGSRGAYRVDRSRGVSSDGPRGNADPAASSSIAG